MQALLRNVLVVWMITTKQKPGKYKVPAGVARWGGWLRRGFGGVLLCVRGFILWCGAVFSVRTPGGCAYNIYLCVVDYVLWCGICGVVVRRCAWVFIAEVG